jgi:hypothetical protein
MTTQEIIDQIKQLHDAVESERQSVAKAAKNTAFLYVARGALKNAMDQLGLHQRVVENPPPAAPETK